MARFVGVWLDHRKACIVEITDDDVVQYDMESTVERHTQSTGGTQLGGNPHFGAANSSERHQTERRQHELTKFYQSIAKVLVGADRIAIAGTKQATSELVTFLDDFPKLAERIVGTETSKPLTERQLVAHFKEIFHQPAPRSAVRGTSV